MDPSERMDATDITVVGSRCLNARNSGSSCRQCERICPADAIAVGPDGITLDPAECIGCGLCVAACPMEVFASDVWSERETVEAVRSAAEPGVELVCPRLYAETGPAAGRVKSGVCLGAYSPGALFEMSLHHDVSLRVDACEVCPLREGLPALRVSARLAGLWIEAATSMRRIECASEDPAHAGADVCALDSADFRRAAALGGRDFHVGFARHGSLLFSAMLEREWSRPRDRRPLRVRLTEQHMPRWRRHLAEVWRADRRTAGARAMWPAITVDASACVACGTCRQYCPTGAIDQRIEDGRFVTVHTPGLCADCGLCAMACTGLAITRLYGETEAPFDEQVVFNEPVAECRACHSPALARGGDLCYWCATEPRMDGIIAQLKRELLGIGDGQAK